MKIDPTIRQAFDERISYRHKIHNKAVRELKAKYPQIQEFSREYFAAMTRCAKGEIKSDELEKISADIERRRRRFLVSIGQSENALEYVPLCPKCNDTGIADGEMCACLKQAHIKNITEASGIAQKIRDESFETFKPELFDLQSSSDAISQRERIVQIRDFYLKYCESFGEKSESLVFYGNPGTGKTFMAHSIAGALLKAGHTVVFMSASALGEKLIDLSFNRIDRSERVILNNAELLVIDDFGAEKSELAKEHLHNIINERIEASKVTLITTNLNPMMVKAQYADRIFSRLATFRWTHFAPGDLRVSMRGKKTQRQQ